MGIHTERNCTGAPLKERGPVMVVDGQPVAIVGATTAAYPDGWFTLSAETTAGFGFSLVDALTHDHDADEPIMHCIRLAWSAPFVFAWLRLYSLIKSQLRTPPGEECHAYDSIMLSIRGAIAGVEYARAKAAADARGAAHG
jgi:hypothetical protein